MMNVNREHPLGYACTVDHLFFADILFRVCRAKFLFANTKIRESAFKKIL
jgi:hypothetical protein